MVTLRRIMITTVLIIFVIYPIGMRYLPQDRDIVLATNDEMIQYWAPVIYQEVSTDPQLHYLDMITPVDYDGDLDASNNWDNLESFKHNLTSVVYNWIRETDHSFYIGYGIYHPRDWTDSRRGVEHENDFEGVVIKIDKDDSKYGKLKSLLSIAHTNLLQFNYKQSMEYEGHRPVVYVETQGHGVYSSAHLDLENTTRNYLKYIPSANTLSSDNPAVIADTLIYSISDIGDLWENKSNPDLFTDYGFFRSDNSGGCGSSRFNFVFCVTDVAAPPWRWTQGQEFPGQLWYHPEDVFNDF